MLDDRILFVDDDENVLDTYQRLLHDKLHIETALGGEVALKLLDATEPFAVIVSDLRMPKMDGIQFLSRVKDKFPDTVRMMLTGNAELETAIHAVNEGNIFRLLTKPCPPEMMIESLIAGIDQYRLTTGEKELLEKTVKGSIQLLTDILSVADPEAFGRTSAYQDTLRMVSERLQVENTWDIEMAWMLSDLGNVVVPTDTLNKMRTSRPLTEDEKRLVAEAPRSVCHILSNIPRIENVGRIILYQNKHFDGSGYPTDAMKGEEIPIESRILKWLVDLAQLESPSHSKAQILKMMTNRAGWYDPKVLEAAAEVLGPDVDTAAPEFIRRSFNVGDLRTGDTLDRDLRTKEGQLLVAGGVTLTEVYLERVRNFARFVGVKEPVAVRRAILSPGEKLPNPVMP